MSTPACTTPILTVPLRTDAPPPKGLCKHIPREPTVWLGSRAADGGRQRRVTVLRSPARTETLENRGKPGSQGEIIFPQEQLSISVCVTCRAELGVPES